MKKMTITYYSVDVAKYIANKLEISIIEAEAYLRAATDSIVKSVFSFKDLVHNQYCTNEDGSLKLRTDGKPRRANLVSSSDLIRIAGLGQFRLIQGGEKYDKYKDNLLIKFDYGNEVKNTTEALIGHLADIVGLKSLSKDILALLSQYIVDKCNNEQARVVIEYFGEFSYCVTNERRLSTGIASKFKGVVPSKTFIKMKYNSSVDYTEIVHEKLTA